MAETKWQKFDPRLGNYEGRNAVGVFRAACAMVGVFVSTAAILGWRRVDNDRTAFRLPAGDGFFAVWTVTMDYDGAPDGHDRCVAVEVRRE